MLFFLFDALRAKDVGIEPAHLTHSELAAAPITFLHRKKPVHLTTPRSRVLRVPASVPRARRSGFPWRCPPRPASCLRSPLDARRSLLEVFCALAIVDHSLTQDERILLTIAESELNLPGFLQHFFAGSSSEFSGNAEYASSSGRDSDNTGGRSRFADDVMVDGMMLVTMVNM